MLEAFFIRQVGIRSHCDLRLFRLLIQSFEISDPFAQLILSWFVLNLLRFCVPVRSSWLHHRHLISFRHQSVGDIVEVVIKTSPVVLNGWILRDRWLHLGSLLLLYLGLRHYFNCVDYGYLIQWGFVPNLVFAHFVPVFRLLDWHYSLNFNNLRLKNDWLLKLFEFQKCVVL